MQIVLRTSRGYKRQAIPPYRYIYRIISIISLGSHLAGLVRLDISPPHQYQTGTDAVLLLAISYTPESMVQLPPSYIHTYKPARPVCTGYPGRTASSSEFNMSLPMSVVSLVNQSNALQLYYIVWLLRILVLGWLGGFRQLLVWSDNRWPCVYLVGT